MLEKAQTPTITPRSPDKIRAKPLLKLTSFGKIGTTDNDSETESEDIRNNEAPPMEGLQSSEEMIRLKKKSQEALRNLKKMLEQEFEESRAQLLHEKEESLRREKDKLERETCSEEEQLRVQKTDKLSILQRQLSTSVENEETILKNTQQEALNRIKERFQEEEEEEERRLGEVMKENLSRIRADIESTIEVEKNKLEEKKKGAGEKIRKEVEEEKEAEKNRLVAVQKQELEDIRASLQIENEKVITEMKDKQERELCRMKSDMEEKHESAVHVMQRHLQETHDSTMEELQGKLTEAQAVQLRQKQAELDMLAERQAVFSTLERDLSDVLREKKEAMKTVHDEELRSLQQEHQTSLQQLRSKFAKQEIELKNNLCENTEKQKAVLLAEQATQLRHLRDEFETRIVSMKSESDAKESELEERVSINAERQRKLDEEMKELENKEKPVMNQRNLQLKLNVVRQDEVETGSQTDQPQALDLQQQTFLDTIDELSQQIQLRQKELQNLNAAITERKAALTVMQTQKEFNAGTIANMVSNRTKSRDEVPTSTGRDGESILVRAEQETVEQEELLDKPLRHAPTLHGIHHAATMTDAPTTTGPMAIQELTTSPHTTQAKLYPRNQALEQNHDYIPREDTTPSKRRQKIERSYKTSQRAWEQGSTEFSSDIEEERVASGDARQSVQQAKSFLREQSRQLKKRAASLRVAKQQWNHDLTNLKKNLPAESSTMLDGIRCNLEQEALEIEQLRETMASSRRLLKGHHNRRSLDEHEVGLNLSDSADDGLYTRGRNAARRRHVSSIDSSSTDDDGDEEDSRYASPGIRAKPRHYTPGGSTTNTRSVADSLHQIDTNLQHVLGFLGTLPGTKTSDITESKPQFQLSGGSSTDAIRMADYLQRIDSNLKNVLGFIGMNTSSGTTGVQAEIPLQKHRSPMMSQQPQLHLPPYTVLANSSYSTVTQPPPFDSYPAHETADRSLQKKWQKYFGSRPLSLSVTSLPPSESAFGYQPASQLLESYRTGTERGDQPPTNIDSQLAEHRKWLKDFQKDLGIGSSLSGSDRGSVISGRLSPVKQPHAVSSSTKMRLELDENNEIRLRSYSGTQSVE
ncbi:PREDICTED: centrosomal protein of 164 kDa-like [Priapulus caudatus]|uniref:Centrosomal protein of 164 kDa-like n=1 Tax=Priapulus caudatus TaxID=37621 RepID=A0ABM1E008_PRICU|nr:PREDICTED: centrosomal protein of 164 kDa-like [Priapulus caudatus]